MNSSIHKVLMFLAAGSVAFSLSAGCSGTNKEPDRSPEVSASSVGSLGLKLVISGGVALPSVNYVVTGPESFTKSGTLDVSSSPPGVIDGIPVANGYRIELSATASDGKTCSGSAVFDITSRDTQSVDVSLQCQAAPRTGSMIVNGKLNVCPSIDSLAATPSAVHVGSSLSLVAQGSDPDAGPAALSYTWTASAGTLSSATGATSSFTCTQVGAATVTLSLSDGDTCPDQRSLTVTCTQPPVEQQPPPPPTSGISTDPNLKVAFIGDTDHNVNLSHVLSLIMAEKAQGLMVQGDMSYSENPDAWWDAVEAALGTDFPIFISRGNHDDSTWPDYLPRAENHLAGATRVPGAHDANYKTTWRGLVTATIRKGDKPENITPFLEGDDHIWKICQWHQNQEAMQIGGKTDEMGWDVYETCREQGAIIETGHEHSYERTRTLTSTIQQTTDQTCAEANALCVGPGRTFVNVVGLGGGSVRPQLRCLPATFPYGCKEEWASIYSSNQNGTYGAQFITFNVDGDPRKAVGYFKDVNGNVIDDFTVKADAPP
jgi:hypothetical protein